VSGSVAPGATHARRRGPQQAVAGAQVTARRGGCGCGGGKHAADRPSRDRACERATHARDRICRLLARLEAFRELVCDGLPDDVATREPCATYVHRICYLTAAAADHNDNLPSQEDRTDETVTMVEALETLLHPVWRPNTKFAVQIQTENIVDGSSKGLRTCNFGFKTEGPVGWFHQFRAEYAALAAEDRAAAFKLATLKPYIDMARSYPDPSGRLAGAKPLFYAGAQLTLAYKHDHAAMLYSDWDALGGLRPVKSSLSVTIKDPGDLLAAPSSHTLFADHLWHQHDRPMVSRELATLDNLLTQSPNCAGRAPESFPGMLSASEPVDLEPSKLYTALCLAKFTDSGNVTRTGRVHEYAFQTSRYADFKAQVESFRRVDEAGNAADAVFRVELAVTGQQLARARSIVRQTMAASDPLIASHADRFDRLLHGALAMTALPAATGTELDLLVRAGTGALLGVLVRNPEPFNQPRLPDAVIAQTLAALNRRADGSGNDGAYVVLFARDLSAALVTNDAMDVPAGTLELTFAYYRHDGSGWAVRAPATDRATLSVTV